MPTSEAGLVGSIVRRVDREYPDAWVFKVHGGMYQMAGVPDLILSVGGLLVGIEVKFQRPGESAQYAHERATPQQRHQIKKINESGAIAGVVTTVEEALDLIARAVVKHKAMEERDVREN